MCGGIGEFPEPDPNNEGGPLVGAESPGRAIEWDIDANLPMYTRDYLRLEHPAVHWERIEHVRIVISSGEKFNYPKEQVEIILKSGKEPRDGGGALDEIDRNEYTWRADPGPHPEVNQPGWPRRDDPYAKDEFGRSVNLPTEPERDSLGRVIQFERDGSDIIAFMRSELPSCVCDEWERRVSEKNQAMFARDYEDDRDGE